MRASVNLLSRIDADATLSEPLAALMAAGPRRFSLYETGATAFAVSDTSRREPSVMWLPHSALHSTEYMLSDHRQRRRIPGLALANTVVSELRALGSIGALKTLMEAVSREMGFRHYALIHHVDPSFPAPIYATLSQGDDGEHKLIWSR